ncbi:MAG: hypothetical protein JXB32_12810 [Deltaproteobacteria bacterium]|nr:hypothetical protein [Deltaproteobacteria bacterium]
MDWCQEPLAPAEDPSCLSVPNDAACDDGALCNGAETCDVSTGCVAGAPWDCSDGIDCTDDVCVEPEPPGTSPSCDYLPHDDRCQNDVFCDGEEQCILELGCQPGTPPTCDDSIDCTHDSCDTGLDACAHSPDDTLCDDGAWCNGPETCDPAPPGDISPGCRRGTPPDCSDGIICTDDGCDEDSDECVWTINLDNCPLPPVCNVPVCDTDAVPAVDCGLAPLPDGTECELPAGGDGVCLDGICIERACGNGIPDPDEECDYAGQLLGCLDTCRTYDFVASDVSAFDGDDGREELGPADHTVAVLDDGRVVLAWTQDEDADPWYADIRIRVLDPATGLVTGDDVLSDLAMPQEHPVVATLGTDRFVVAWQGYGEDTGGEDVDIYLRLCNVSLVPGIGDLGDRLAVACLAPVRANTTVGEAQLHPTLAVSPLRDRFVLAWEDWSAYGEGSDPWGLCGIRYRMFAVTDGRPATGFTTDARANSTTAGAQTEPAVAIGATGEFLVAWTDDSGTEPEGSGTAIHAQRFNAAGVAVGTEFRINTRVDFEQYEPSVAAVEFPEPGYVVAWTDLEDDGRLTVRANFVFAGGGLDPASELVLPHVMTPPPTLPARPPMQSAASLAAGADAETLVAVWMEEPRGAFRLADDSFTAIAGVRLGVDCPGSGSCAVAVLSTADVLLNTTWPDVQETPSAAFGAAIYPGDPSGPLALAWTDWSDADRSGGLNEVRLRYLPHGWVLEATP